LYRVERGLDVGAQTVKTALVAAPEASLEALVRDELRPAVAELVRRLAVDVAREELERLNVETAQATNGRAELSTKRCSVCNETKPLADFARTRSQCRACRSRLDAEARRRRARAPARREARDTASNEDDEDAGLAESG
jgi:hypothetical protein